MLHLNAFLDLHANIGLNLLTESVYEEVHGPLSMYCSQCNQLQQQLFLLLPCLLSDYCCCVHWAQALLWQVHGSPHVSYRATPYLARSMVLRLKCQMVVLSACHEDGNRLQEVTAHHCRNTCSIYGHSRMDLISPASHDQRTFMPLNMYSLESLLCRMCFGGGFTIKTVLNSPPGFFYLAFPLLIINGIQS